MANRNPWPVDTLRWAEWEYNHGNSRIRDWVDRYAGDDDQETTSAVAHADELPAGAAMAIWIAMWVGDQLRRHAPGFIAGCYFTVAAAWVWSWFL